MSYGYSKELSIGFEEAVRKTKEELKKEGFGVLTEINVKEIFKQKLNVDYEDYIILGACNPLFAYNALQTEKEIGLLLPCNVIVYRENGKTHVSVIDPLKAMSIVDNPKLREVAQKVGEKLKGVVNKL